MPKANDITSIGTNIMRVRNRVLRKVLWSLRLYADIAIRDVSKTGSVLRSVIGGTDN